MARWRRVFEEPLVVFAAGAALLFGVDGVLRPQPADRIHVTAAQIEALAALHEARTGARPSQDNLRRAVRQLIEEEALFRHGARLGVVEGDPIVRRRVVAKLREAARRVPDPDDATLERWYADHAAEFSTPILMSVEHRFYGDGPSAHAAASAAARRDDPPPGRTLAFGDRLAGMTTDRLGQYLGAETVQRALTAPIDEWFGPVESPYGWHVVRVLERRPHRVPPFAEVEAAVARAFRRQAEARAERATVERIVESLDVTIDWPDAEVALAGANR